MLNLKNDRIEILVDEMAGAALMSARYYTNDGRWLEFMPDCIKDSTLNEASFIMAPYSNRIVNGSFKYQGKDYQLKRADEHSIHGDVRHRSWEVEKVNTERAILVCDLTNINNRNWPWPFKARYTIELKEAKIEQTLKLINMANEKVPLGGGFHPYFLRRLKGDTQDVQVSLPVKAIYPTGLIPAVPTGPPVQTNRARKLRALNTLSPTDFFDDCFLCGYGDATINWPSKGLTIKLTFSGTVNHLVFYNPERNYFAIEPVSHANNAINGAGGSTMNLVEPSGVLEISYTITF